MTISTQVILNVPRAGPFQAIARVSVADRLRDAIAPADGTGGWAVVPDEDGRMRTTWCDDDGDESDEPRTPGL